jgi:hypothetical protein
MAQKNQTLDQKSNILELNSSDIAHDGSVYYDYHNLIKWVIDNHPKHGSKIEVDISGVTYDAIVESYKMQRSAPPVYSDSHSTFQTRGYIYDDIEFKILIPSRSSLTIVSNNKRWIEGGFLSNQYTP